MPHGWSSPWVSRCIILRGSGAHGLSFRPCVIIHISRLGPKSMKATYHRGVHKFALFVVAWTTVLLTAGALVTSEDAALAVPDWPLSYGTLNPPMVGGIAFEHSHRLIAAALGLLVIILASLLSVALFSRAFSAASLS